MQTFVQDISSLIQINSFVVILGLWAQNTCRNNESSEWRWATVYKTTNFHKKLFDVTFNGMGVYMGVKPTTKRDI